MPRRPIGSSGSVTRVPSPWGGGPAQAGCRARRAAPGCRPHRQTRPAAPLGGAPAGPGPAATAATALQLALDGNTVHLGRLLAPLGVRYVVVIDGINPVGPEG